MEPACRCRPQTGLLKNGTSAHRPPQAGGTSGNRSQRPPDAVSRRRRPQPRTGPTRAPPGGNYAKSGQRRHPSKLKVSLKMKMKKSALIQSRSALPPSVVPRTRAERSVRPLPGCANPHCDRRGYALGVARHHFHRRRGVRAATLFGNAPRPCPPMAGGPPRAVFVATETVSASRNVLYPRLADRFPRSARRGRMPAKFTAGRCEPGAAIASSPDVSECGGAVAHRLPGAATLDRLRPGAGPTIPQRESYRSPGPMQERLTSTVATGGKPNQQLSRPSPGPAPVGGSIDPDMGGSIRAVRDNRGTGIAELRDCARTYRRKGSVHGAGEDDAVGR